ncbi:MAG: lytic murein transglycosylase [Bacteroidetes bacterium]|nr:lytic murein transglycosylase [Bacteroidota bacterium]
MKIWLTIAAGCMMTIAGIGVVMYMPQDDIKPGPKTNVIDTTATTSMQRAAAIAVSKGVDTMFIRRILSVPQTGFDSQCVRINVTNYAKKTDYSLNVNEMSVKSVRTFIADHDSLLLACEERYNVPKEVIASILWIETKFGRVLGKHHLPSVYLSVMLSAEPEFIEKNLEAVRTGADVDSARIDSVRRLIATRAHRKVNWAAEQLKALDKIDRNGTLDVAALYGSWAGAFGMTQFIPSSYLQWAADGDGDGSIDLYTLSDAVYSVANYLRTNGWGPSSEQQRKAIYHYNNSNDYVDAVLKLADRAELPGR